LPPATTFDTIARLAGAIVLAFAAIAVVKSRHRGAPALVARAVAGLALGFAAVWIVFWAFPDPAAVGTETLSIVATVVFVAALAAEELIGNDVRRMLGL